MIAWPRPLHHHQDYCSRSQSQTWRSYWRWVRFCDSAGCILRLIIFPSSELKVVSASSVRWSSKFGQQIVCQLSYLHFKYTNVKYQVFYSNLILNFQQRLHWVMTPLKPKICHKFNASVIVSDKLTSMI